MTSLVPLVAALAMTAAGQTPLPSLRGLTAPPAHRPAVEAALGYCLARAGDGATPPGPAGFARSEDGAARWLYPAGRGAALRVSVTDSVAGCSLVIQQWPGATEPVAAWLRARGYRAGAQPTTLERVLPGRRLVRVSHMRGTRDSLLMFVSGGPAPAP